MQAAIVQLFRHRFGVEPEGMERVAADGSQRLYYRLFGREEGTVIGGHGPDPDENRAFWHFSEVFRGLDLPVPRIHAVEEARGLWLMEDLGDTTLFSRLQAERPEADEAFPPALVPIYRRVLEVLPRFQIEGGRAVDFRLAYPREAFDERSMRWDLNYFKYHFLKLAHIPFHEERLEGDFDRLVAYLLDEEEGAHFLYRDFQSRNVMLRDGDEPWFIDYQGGRRGPLHYDVASLLYDAKAAIPDAVRDELLRHYLEALSDWTAVDGERFRIRFRGFVLIRILQAMGAYGYRGFYEKKARFLESVPHAARNLESLMASGLPVALPELEQVFARIVASWASSDGDVKSSSGLTVDISSFSYRQGYPSDDRGHGGGFVFDCRALPNPGRLPEHEASTGQDSEVIRFFEEVPAVEEFWEEVLPLVERHLRRYRDRGFTDMSVAFGCTGGQHRSVYMAERLADHLRDHHPDVGVRLRHRARRSWPGGDRDAAWKP